MWRLGSYITQGVYTVSGPFHPFGGAVDIVVVQQEDGSLKSSPWYVKFGKFQGVLKAKERVVDINVNGVDAEFHMYLDQRGEAYFLREVDSDESLTFEDVEGKGSGSEKVMPVTSKSMDSEFDQLNTVRGDGRGLGRSGSKRSRLMGFVLGRRSMKEQNLLKDGNDGNGGRMGSLESAEMAADLLEMRWSTNLSSRSDINVGRETSSDNGSAIGGRLETSMVLHEEHFVDKVEGEETIVADVVHDVDKDVPEDIKTTQLDDTHDVDKEVSEDSSRTKLDDSHDVNKDIPEDNSRAQLDDSHDVDEETKLDDSHDVNKDIPEDNSLTQLDDSCDVDEETKLDNSHDVIKEIHEDSSRTQLDDSHDANEDVPADSSSTQLDDSNEAEVRIITAEGALEIVPESYAEGAHNQGDASKVVSCSTITVPVDEMSEISPLEPNVEFQDVAGDAVVFKEVSERVVAVPSDEVNEIRPTLEPNGEFQDVSGDAVLIKEVSERVVAEQLTYNDIDNSKPCINKIEQEVKSTTVIQGPDPPPVRTFQEQIKVDIEGVNGNNFRRCPTYVDITRSSEIKGNDVLRRSKSLPNMRSHVDDITDNHEEPQFYSPVGKFRSSHWDLIREDALRIQKEKLEKELSQSGDNMSKDLTDGSISSGGSWSLWPFRRSGSKIVPEKKDPDVDIIPETDGVKEDASPKLDKMHTRALVPTPEQLASLNLAEGQNTVTFTFSTSVLGAQKVDARIYLWRWDTRIVISDVDGTITKSDVLGQFMPLVGRDWSHIGVTHLFSGIKENGYQMLYLSARAISQASLTRQFLFNLKQDGKALPDGPVVISPDGLFPSLFREVIRRAPHEFKIACLEDIKSCFPSDRNPFYAGFGNRDTDEFSYLKVGIPKGKIFIINPKGEVIINRCIDSKSYASLHALVNGIFPPVSVHEEQEDYNSWNFWKLPPPNMD